MELAAAGCSQPCTGSVLERYPVWDGLCAPRKGHIRLVFAMLSWCCFPWNSQSFGLTLHDTSLGWWDLPPLCCASLHPGAICCWLGWVCWGLLQMWGFGSGTARIAVPSETESRAGGTKPAYLHGGQDRGESTRLYST